MINQSKNAEINKLLTDIYTNATSEFLSEYGKAFKDKDSTPPSCINEFGIINESKYDTDNGILFVLKETNGWSNGDFDEGILFRGWLNDVSLTGLEGKGHIKKHPSMWYNMGRWIMAIQNKDADVRELSNLKDEAIAALINVAITNVNKVRGYNSAKKEYSLLAYSDIAGKVLAQELEVLRPRYIVCCGTYHVLLHHVGEMLKGRIDRNECNVLDMSHPAARRSSIGMLEELRAQL